MPCHSAIMKKSVTVSPEDTVESVLKTIRKAKVSVAGVIDEKGILLGIFSMKALLQNLIPVSVAMADGVQLDIKMTAAPGVAKRLTNMQTLPVSDIMDRKPLTVVPDAPIWEGVSLLVKHGGPLVVADDTGRFHGFITYDSFVEDLENMKTTDS